jgi:hypothetical protein
VMQTMPPMTTMPIDPSRTAGASGMSPGWTHSVRRNLRLAPGSARCGDAARVVGGGGGERAMEGRSSFEAGGARWR